MTKTDRRSAVCEEGDVHPVRRTTPTSLGSQIETPAVSEGNPLDEGLPNTQFHVSAIVRAQNSSKNLIIELHRRMCQLQSRATRPRRGTCTRCAAARPG